MTFFCFWCGGKNWRVCLPLEYSSKLSQVEVEPISRATIKSNVLTDNEYSSSLDTQEKVGSTSEMLLIGQNHLE